MIKLFLVTFSTFICTKALGKEIALTFDDVPFQSTPHFETNVRTDTLIQKLNELKIPPVVIFANPCKREDAASVLKQLGKYKNRGDLIGNHTCTHPRLDKVGFTAFSQDSERADQLLKPLLADQKFFRFPFLNEGNDPEIRDKMRAWLKEKGYRNGMVSADNEDPLFSFKINQAKKLGKKINYEKVKTLFLEHILTSLDCDEKLALKTIGYSPKHVILLHERDATVMFLDSLVAELHRRGWTIISAADAYQDPLYSQAPKNTKAGFGIISQVAFERTGEKTVCYDFEAVSKKLNEILALTKEDLDRLSKEPDDDGFPHPAHHAS